MLSFWIYFLELNEIFYFFNVFFFKELAVGNEENVFKNNPKSESSRNYSPIPNAYLVEFDQQSGVKNFQYTISEHLERSHGIPRSAIQMRQIISSSLFSGASFSVNSEHSAKMIESIPNVIAIYPVYSIPGPEPVKEYIQFGNSDGEQMDQVISHHLTGVDKVHEQLQNFGEGVRVRRLEIAAKFFFHFHG